MNLLSNSLLIIDQLMNSDEFSSGFIFSADDTQVLPVIGRQA